MGASGGPVELERVGGGGTRAESRKGATPILTTLPTAGVLGCPASENFVTPPPASMPQSGPPVLDPNVAKLMSRVEQLEDLVKGLSSTQHRRHSPFGSMDGHFAFTQAKLLQQVRQEYDW
jgi:hypothetical protein